MYLVTADTHKNSIKITISQLHMAFKHITVKIVLQLCVLFYFETEMASSVMFCASPLCFPLVTYRETSMGVKLNFAYQM